MDSYDKSSPAQRHTNLLEWFIDETGASESPVNLYRLHLQLHLIQRLKQNVKGERRLVFVGEVNLLCWAGLYLQYTNLCGGQVRLLALLQLLL